MTSPLPPLRRIVTGHNNTGQAIIKYDDKITAKVVPHGAALRSLWITDSSPADLSSQSDNADAKVGIFNNGSVFRIVDFPPRTSGHMHRTISIDYAIVQKGTAVLVLDDGSRTSVGEGDVVVQQGTMHGWDNPTDEWVRLLVVLLPAKAPIVAGKELKTDTSSLGM
ncbi:cupin domain protein [Fusarium tjaetaba]|uniref:Cupin domain protein n=1 Tax=Fusarium tjaetaba TaxID=1567544 RepID=A0A8H5VCQ2_9HYPO|nr:cupin domain protein [Fusarium tjaetaba]KAF5617225.1 cupin domain protein [Fusarium tjaetaba]